MTNGKWIAYVGPFMFPWGQPGSRRVYGIARALTECGYKVVIGSGQWGGGGLFSDEECSDIEYTNLGDLPRPGASTSQKLIQLFYESGLRTVEWLESMPNRPAFVFTYGAGAPFMCRVSEWCKTNNVPLIADVVEWYDGSHMAGGYMGPFHLSAKVAMHYYFPRCDGVVAISEYLAVHYRKISARVLRVPPIVDVSSVRIVGLFEPLEGRKIRLVYAGTPGKKDLLATVIRGVEAVDPLGEHFELDVLGPSTEQVQRLLGSNHIPISVNVLGRLSQADIPERLQRADFSVLLREPKRFANAGFPTKFVESLTNGTPVIANLTSDLVLYLHDGVEGVVCADHTEQSLSAALRRISKMSSETLLEMRLNAREQAQKSFDYRNYVCCFSEFLKGI